MKTIRQYIRKADIILFIVLVATGLAVSAVLAVTQAGAGAGGKVVIESSGDLYATYPLSEDRTVVVPAPKQHGMDAPAANAGGNGDTDASGAGTDGSGDAGSAAASAQYDYYNVVEISGGSVRVSEASCKNQVCVHHSSISRPGESIVCLPNRLVVRIDAGGGESDGNGEGGGYDTITS